MTRHTPESSTFADLRTAVQASSAQRPTDGCRIAHLWLGNSSADPQIAAIVRELPPDLVISVGTAAPSDLPLANLRDVASQGARPFDLLVVHPPGGQFTDQPLARDFLAATLESGKLVAAYGSAQLLLPPPSLRARSRQADSLGITRHHNRIQGPALDDEKTQAAFVQSVQQALRDLRVARTVVGHPFFQCLVDSQARLFRVEPRDDAKQSAALHIFEQISWGHYGDPEALLVSGYFVVAIARAMLTFRRRMRSRIQLNEELDPSEVEAPLPDEQLRRLERAAIVRREVLKLAPRERDLLKARYDDEVDAPTAAKRVGASTRNAQRILHRAKELLRRRLSALPRHEAELFTWDDEN